MKLREFSTLLCVLCAAVLHLGAQAQRETSWGLHRVDIESPTPIDSLKKSTAVITLRDDGADLFSGFNGLCGIELHGNSSLHTAKRSYEFELRTELGEERSTSLLGMAPGDDFVLLACTFDRSFQRNVLAFELWSALGHYAPDYRFCELYLNGEYQGFYLLTERIKVDAHRVDLEVQEAAHSLHELGSPPFLFHFDWAHPHASIYGKSLTDEALHIRFDFPKLKNLSTSRWAIHHFLDAVESSFQTASILGENPPALIDTLSFVDYFLVQELAKNPDGLKTSAYFYRRQASMEDPLPPLCAGPVWDFDLAFDNVAYEAHNVPEGWAFQQVGPMSNVRLLPVWWHSLFADAHFRQLCRQRLAELDALFSPVQVQTLLEKNAFLYGAAMARDREMWSHTELAQEAGPLRRTAQEDLRRIVQFYDARMHWMAAHLDSASVIVAEAGRKAAQVQTDLQPNEKQEVALHLPQVLYEVKEAQFYRCEVINRYGERPVEPWLWMEQGDSLRFSTAGWPPGAYYLEVTPEIPHYRPERYDLMPLTSYAPYYLHPQILSSAPLPTVSYVIHPFESGVMAQSLIFKANPFAQSYDGCVVRIIVGEAENGQ